MKINEKLMEVLKAIRSVGGRSLVVGGCVRDDLLGIAPKDYDTEVYGPTYRQLTEILVRFGKPNLVGASFGVIKVSVNGQEYDFSLPRTESKVGIKHTDFSVDFSPDLTPEQACARRDFTINAIAFDPFTDEYIDPFGGRQDLEAGLLRPTSPAFVEDALRVLRGMQFAGRFKLTPSVDACGANAVEMYLQCRKEYHALPKERVWGEWSKWAEKSVIPSLGLKFLQFADWLELFPMLNDLQSCWQDSRWHPEGWSFDVAQGDIAPIYSALASSAKSIGVNDRLSFREFISVTSAQAANVPTFAGAAVAQPVVNLAVNGITAANAAGTLAFDSPSPRSPAINTQSESLVWSIRGTAPPASKIVRVMFEVPLSCMKSVMQGTVNDFQIIDGVIKPVTVFVMDMFLGQQFASQYQFHNISVNPDASPISFSGVRTTASCNVRISAVVVDAKRYAVDNNVIFYLDFAFVGDFENVKDKLYMQQSDTFYKIEVGNALIHTFHVCDAMARICDRDGIVGEERIVRMMAALCHDIGKPSTTEHCDDGRIRSQMHCEVGSKMARTFLESIGCFTRIIDQVVPLVAEHLVHIRFPSTPRTVRRLAMRLNAANVNQLASLVEADQSGRPPLHGGLPDEMKGIIELAATLKVAVEKPKAILNGDLLMAEFGYKQGKALGDVLRAAFQAQLDGEFETEEQGIQWVRDSLVKEVSDRIG